MNILDGIDLALENIEKGDFSTAELIYLQLIDQFPNNRLLEHLHSQVQGALQARNHGTAAEKKLLDAFINNQTHYTSVPEYNLNWALNDISPLEEFLNLNPITLVDVGARDGFLGEVEGLKKHINYFGFDADEEECNRLNENPPQGFNSFSMLPYFVGKSKESLDFHIYNSPGDSSSYLPASEFVKKFRPSFGVNKSVNVKPVNLSDIFYTEKINSVDLLKLDTQGTELDILKSAKNDFNKFLLIEAEVEIFEMYEGQPLIGEFVNYMNQQGFDVLYINRVFQTRSNYNGPSRGQITFCDILFAKRDEYYCYYSDVDLAKHAILLANYGHLDIAHDIWNGFSSVRKLIPNLNSYFKAFDSDAQRIKNMSIDKLLCWQLHIRKTNQISSDSDRSWPIR